MPDKFFALAGLVLDLFKIIPYIVVCVGGGRGRGKGYYVVFICFFFSSVVRKIK